LSPALPSTKPVINKHHPATPHNLLISL
jgi:hypothetical protein